MAHISFKSYDIDDKSPSGLKLKINQRPMRGSLPSQSEPLLSPFSVFIRFRRRKGLCESSIMGARQLSPGPVG